MKFQLWYNLKRVKNDLKPRGQFKHELGASLSKRFDQIYGQKSVWYRFIWVRTTRVILASTVGVSMVTTSVYAYNSPTVTDGSILYPIKIGLEKVEEKTKTTPELKAKFLLKKVQRREAERQTVESRVGSEISFTFSAVTPTTTQSSTIEFTTTSITVSTKPAELEHADSEVRKLEHQLSEIQNQLGDSNEDEVLRGQINVRLSKHDEQEDSERLTNAFNDSSSQSSSSTTSSDKSNLNENIPNNLNTSSNFVEFRIRREDGNKTSRIKSITNRLFGDSSTLTGKEINKDEQVKIIRTNSGELKVVDNEHEYKIYSSSTNPTTLEQIISTSSPIRLEIKNKKEKSSSRFILESKGTQSDVRKLFVNPEKQTSQTEKRERSVTEKSPRRNREIKNIKEGISETEKTRKSEFVQTPLFNQQQKTRTEDSEKRTIQMNSSSLDQLAVPTTTIIRTETHESTSTQTQTIKTNVPTSTDSGSGSSSGGSSGGSSSGGGSSGGSGGHDD